MALNHEENHEFKRLRAAGVDIKRAREWAKVNVRFKALESRGLVQLRVEPEFEPHDASYVDTWDASEEDKQRARQLIRDRIEHEGLHRVSSFMRCPVCATMHQVDSVGDFIGEDWCDSGYDIDLKRAAMRQRDALVAQLEAATGSSEPARQEVSQ